MLDIVEWNKMYITHVGDNTKSYFPNNFRHKNKDRTYHQVACGREHAVYIYSDPKDNPIRRRIQGIGRNGFSQMGISLENIGMEKFSRYKIFLLIYLMVI